MKARRGGLLLAGGTLLTGVAIVVAVGLITGDVRAQRTADPQASAAPSAAIPDAANGFVAGASAAITAVTQYDYRSLDDALSAGLDVTTGAYQRAYRTALTGTTAARVRADREVETFELTAAGIGSISADLRTGRVTIFGIQSVTKNGGTATKTPLTLTATMLHRGDRYLISALELDANPGLPTDSRDLAAAAETARQAVVADLTSGGATGRVTALAIESATAQQITTLVAGNATRTVDGSARTVADVRLRVVVGRSGDGWQVVSSQPALS